jgi:transcriptional regulator with XRE-family HTH domain
MARLRGDLIPRLTTAHRQFLVSIAMVEPEWAPRRLSALERTACVEVEAAKPSEARKNQSNQIAATGRRIAFTVVLRPWHPREREAPLSAIPLGRAHSQYVEVHSAELLWVRKLPFRLQESYETKKDFQEVQLRMLQGVRAFRRSSLTCTACKHTIAYMSVDLATTMGQRLRELRERAGLSLREVAKAAKISAPFLSDVELGRRFPTNETLALIARKLRTPAEDLKKHDHRFALAELKRLAESSPSLAAAVRSLVDQVQSGNVTPDELAAKLRSVGNTK